MPGRAPSLGFPPARFTPYAAARTRPHVVVDGAPHPSTRLTLSHWPNNRTPAAFRRDTSTATVFAWGSDPGEHEGAPWVTTNHFDEDGLFSVYGLVAPEAARAERALLEAAAATGDFGLVTDLDAARLCFAIETLSDPEVSSLPPEVFVATDRVAALYEAMLDALPALIRDLRDGWPRFGDLWAAQDEHLAASRTLLADGVVSIIESPALDLAVIRIPAYLRQRTARRYLKDESAVVHPFAINSATECSRLLKVQGTHYEFQYRYESWVQLASHRVPLRVKLHGLADRLNDLERGTAWAAEPPDDVVPRLHRSDGSPSSLPLDTLLLELENTLTTAPVAWDPYDWPQGESA